MRHLLILGLLTLAGTFAGTIHPLGDSLAVFRSQIAFGVLVLAGVVWMFGRRLFAVLGACFAIAVGATVWSLLLFPDLPRRAVAQELGVQVYQKNMSFRMPDTSELAADILSTDVAHITLQEVDSDNRKLLSRLAKDFPTQWECGENRAVGGMAVLSRWPATNAEPLCNWGFAAMQVQGPDRPVWLVSVHLNWPFPHSQARQVDLLSPILEGLERPVIIGGDFNMVPYAAASRQIRQAAGVQAMPRLHNSFPRFGPLVPLAIDHIWAPHVDDVQLRPLLGSDHLGVLARVAF